MPSEIRRATVESARRALRVAARQPAMRRAMDVSNRSLRRLSEIATREIGAALAVPPAGDPNGSQAAVAEGAGSPVGAGEGRTDGEMPFANPHGSGAADDDGLYGAAYFGAGRNPGDRENLSGYASYDRVSSNANLQAYVTWRTFDSATTLDIGCALGFAVEAFREIGFDAQGTEYSHYAVDNCTTGARGFVRQGDLLEGLPYEDGQFDLVTAFEILEHLPPADVPAAIAEIRRVTKSFVFATIPTFGPNEFGPDGWFSGKVLDDRLAYYDSLPATYDGPVPYEDLMVDKEGHPIEGHLCIASFAWWQQQFEAAGFERCGLMERRLYPQIDRFGLTGWWCLYVLRVPGAELPPENLRDPQEIAAIEKKWELDELEERVAATHAAALEAASIAAVSADSAE